MSDDDHGCSVGAYYPRRVKELEAERDAARAALAKLVYAVGRHAKHDPALRAVVAEAERVLGERG